MTCIAHVSVVVPAADEQDTIERCVDSVLIAVESVRADFPTLSTGVVVVLDRCTDSTAQLVKRYPDVLAVRSTARSVGVARQLGSAVSLRRSPVSPARTWLAHTDADSTVPADWLGEQVRYAALGAQLVLGTVEPDLGEPLLSAWRDLHSDADGHSHVHGANLGIRGDVLTDLGGWPRLRTGEDVALAELGRTAGLQVRSVGGLPVRTSSRRIGRAPTGFSGYLRRLDAGELTANGS